MNESDMQPIFVCGCPRSGTTLLGAMLGSHPGYVAVPEAQWLVAAINRASELEGKVEASSILDVIQRNWRFRLWDIDADVSLVDGGIVDVAEIIRRLVKRYADKHGRANPVLWIDHTPEHVRFLTRLFDVFPSARAVHLIRDGRAVAASVLPLDWGPNGIIHAANWWMARVGSGAAAEQQFGTQKVVRVYYEDIVRSPGSALQELCAKLGIDYHAAMLDGTGFDVPGFTNSQHALVGNQIDTSRIDRWKTQFSAREIELFEFVTGDVLRYFGYELASRNDAPPPSRWERVSSDVRHLIRSQVMNRFRLRKRRGR